ncbi:MAG: beta-ketoacyl synthase N-terminal-like domain-containing protein, partial [Planctomycetia bacterium]
MNRPSATSPATTPVVVACCRTAIGRSHAARGVFRHVRGDELAAAAIRAVVDRGRIDPALVDDVVFGATQQRGELGGNVARCAALMAGLPFSVAGVTVNRLCGSSLEAVAQASHAIAAGAADVLIAGGVEHMHHLPMDAAVDIHPRVYE